MLIYIITFIISGGFTFLAQKMFEKEKKNLGIFASFFAIILPAIVAGLRDSIIGTDTRAYIRYFNYACDSNSFLQYNNLSRLEIGYDLIIYIVSRIANNYHVFLFVTELLVIIPIYMRAYERRKENSMTLTMIVAYLLMFNMSLNINRQCIAIAIITYGLKYVENKNFIKFVITVLIAMTFHLTAIVTLPIYFIFWIVKTKHKGFAKVLIICLVLFCVLGIISIAQFLIDYGLLPNAYSDYLTVNSTAYIDEKQLLLRAIFIIIMIYGYRKLKKEDQFIESYTILIIVELILSQLGGIYTWLNRISFFYQMPIYIYILPCLRKAFKDDRLNKSFYNLLCITVLFVYWYYTTVYLGYYDTVPYISQII